VHRGRLLIAGTGVLVSAVVIASAIAAAGPRTHHAADGVTPILAAGAASGPALQSSGLGAAGPASSRAPSPSSGSMSGTPAPSPTSLGPAPSGPAPSGTGRGRQPGPGYPARSQSARP
jgi:hypothetical protein